MQTVLMLVGLPASGKSTYAKSLLGGPVPWVRINYDQYRWYEKDGQPKNYRFSNENEKEIKKRGDDEAAAAVDAGNNIVIDNTNLTAKAFDHWRDFARVRSLNFHTIPFDTSLDECITRNALRTGWQHVPRAVIERMALSSGRVKFPVGQRVVIVDVDGTLADLDHRQKYLSGICWYCNGRCAECSYCNATGKQKKDWKQFFLHAPKDSPIVPTIRWVQQLRDTGYYICIVSGRPLDLCGESTVCWLEKYEVPFNRIFMRAGGDQRDDTIVKSEIFDALGAYSKNQVEFVIDDRPKVIRMWRDRGLKVYDVGDGKEF